MRTSLPSSTRAKRRTARAVVTAAAFGAVAAVPFAVAGPAQAADGNTWNQLAQCESSGNWHINTGNGYYGGLQFSASTWSAFGGDQYASRADLASRSQQIATAEKVLDVQGWGAWPACSSELGLDSSDAAGSPGAPSQHRSTTPKQHHSTAPQHHASSAPDGGSYTVRSGDTLSKIASSQGVSGGWRALYAANRGTISNPNVIYVGQHLQLP